MVKHVKSGLQPNQNVRIILYDSGYSQHTETFKSSVEYHLYQLG